MQQTLVWKPRHTPRRGNAASESGCQWHSRHQPPHAGHQGQQHHLCGNWLLDGVPRPDLQQCQHVILSASPFIHTPALQRSALETGQSDEMQVAYIDMLSFKVEPRQQRYQCLRRRPGESLYRSQAEGHAHEELSVDDHALLLKADQHYLRLSQRDLKVSALV